MLDDSVLLHKCLKKDPDALGELYKQISSRLFGICVRYAKDMAEAEDLLHDGFIRVMNNLKSYRGEGSFEGWVRRIMVTTAINNYRRNKNYPVDNSDMVTVGKEKVFDEDIVSQIANDELLAYVRELPDGYRMVFNLYAIEGYKHREIGEIMGITESTSKTQFAKARQHLQERIFQTAKAENVGIEKK